MPISNQLPSSRSPTLDIVQPSQQEIQHQLSHNGTAWRGALSFDAYLRRENFLSSQGIAKDSGLTSWILVDKAAPASERVVLAGCETLRKRALVSRQGKVSEVVCHGVCSVFTPDSFRGRGYAGRMIAELGKKLKTWQIKDNVPCLLSVLYSDIGKKFYAAHGWHPFHSAHVHISPRDLSPTSGRSNEQIRALYAADLANLCLLDEKLLHRRLARWYGPNTAVALVCDYPTIQWHHAREEFVANELYGRKPDIKGAMAEVDGHRVWCIWTRVWANDDPRERKGNTLHVLRLTIEGDNLDYEGSDHSPAHIAGIAAVLRFASQQAHEWHMEEVELWNPQPRSLLAAQQLNDSVRVIHRDIDSVTSLKWYGDEEDQVEWLENEKYGWC